MDKVSDTDESNTRDMSDSTPFCEVGPCGPQRPI